MAEKKIIVRIVKINNTWGHVVCDDYGAMEALYKRFSVPVENYWFMPKYRAGVWDGKIHFVSDTGRFYNGLLSKILKFFGDEYEIELDEEYKRKFPDINELKKEFIEYTDKTLTTLDPYIYQWRGALKALYYGRAICEHGTGSGKSYTITMIVNYLLYKNPKHKVLILVPKLDLIEQFYEDMTDYGIDKKIIGKFCGHQKDTEQSIIVSTWQSMYKQPKLLKEFTIFIGDETHGLKSEIIRSVAEKAINCDIRIGVTGTMPDNKSDRLLIEGVIGPVVDQALYDELQKLKTISPLKINFIKLLYSNDILKGLVGADYQLEKKFLEEEPKRNNIICKIADKYAKVGKNTLILVKKIDHGKSLVKSLKELGYDADFVTGEMKIDDRTEVRHDIETKEGKIIVATVGVYSTGVSINRLHILIFAAAGKSKIQTLQSVGRGLRKHPTKESLLLFDIGDNLESGNKHGRNRIRYYDLNKFDYTIKEVIIS